MHANGSDHWCFFVILAAVNATFGYLFLLFSSDPQYHGEECKNDNYLSWCLGTALSCFFTAMVCVITVVLFTCPSKFFLDFLKYSVLGCFIYSTICLLGLNSSIDDKCQDLYTLTTVYLIFALIVFFITLMGLCFALCLLSGASLFISFQGQQHPQNQNLNQNSNNNNNENNSDNNLNILNQANLQNNLPGEQIHSESDNTDDEQPLNPSQAHRPNYSSINQ